MFSIEENMQGEKLVDPKLTGSARNQEAWKSDLAFLTIYYTRLSDLKLDLNVCFVVSRHVVEFNTKSPPVLLLLMN